MSQQQMEHMHLMGAHDNKDTVSLLKKIHLSKIKPSRYNN
jgi:hypothetical protein